MLRRRPIAHAHRQATVFSSDRRSSPSPFPHAHRTDAKLNALGIGKLAPAASTSPGPLAVGNRGGLGISGGFKDLLLLGRGASPRTDELPGGDLAKIFAVLGHIDRARILAVLRCRLE